MKSQIKQILDNQKDSLEQLGTKEKFWFVDEDKEKKLFKIGRPGTGEDWVEVVSSEICELLDIPHAKYEFATYEGNQGTITTNFVPQNGRLIHGNELLVKICSNMNIQYEPTMKYKLREYKLRLIRTLLDSATINLKKIKPTINPSKSIPEISTAFDMFIGYIMLDCLISNQDRHHENWGIIIFDKDIFLAPTFDHASGLGNKEGDDEKQKRLETKDKNFSVKAFVKKAKTPFYHKSEKTLSTLDAFKLCYEWEPAVANYWLSKLDKINEAFLYKIFNKIPDNIISQISVKFAIEIIKENKIRLLEIKEEKDNEQ